MDQVHQDSLWQPPKGLDKKPKERLVVLQAPTGYGKTCLAQHWYQQHTGDKFWLTLQPEQNSPVALFCKLVETLDLTGDYSAEELSGVSVDRLLTLLQNQLKQLKKPTLLVIDNLHHIDKHAIELIKLLLEHPLLTSVIASHHHHSELLAAYEMSGQVRWITRLSLELKDKQLQQLLADLPNQLNPEQIAQYQTALQGWPAPWRMLHRRLTAGDQLTPESLTLLGINLADYLVQENIEPLSHDLKELLLGLISLPEFKLETAYSLFPRTELQYQLNALLQQQLFLYKQADRFCFVPFFRQTYKHYLAKHSPERLTLSLHAACRALMKESDRKMSAQIVRELNSPVMAQEWLLKFGWDAFHHARYSELSDLLSLLSERQRKNNPEIALLQGWLILEGEKDSGASNQWQKQLDTLTWQPLQLARLTALQAETVYQFDLLEEALSLSEQALQDLTSPHDLMSAMFTRAMSLMWLGDIGSAHKQLRDVAPLAITERQFHIALAASIRQSNAAMLKADMASANRFAEQADTLATQHNLIDDFTFDAIVRTRLELAIRQGQLADARNLLASANKTQKPRGDYWLFANQTWALVLAVLQGEPCQDLIEKMEQRLSQDFTCRRWRFRAHSALQMAYHWQGDTEGLARLKKWLSWHKQPVDLHDGYDNLLFVRHCLLSNHQLPGSVESQASYWQQKGATLLAQQLTWMVQLSKPENDKTCCAQLGQWLKGGYLWDALVLGPSYANRWQKIPSDFAATPSVLDAFSRLNSLLSQVPAIKVAKTLSSPDPRLTKKEWRVLQGIGKGYSNDQIAAQMHVALSTVKSHINHIYNKLDLNNRAEAKAEAVRLSRQQSASTY
ncbi:LuxR C-terminal-related transcriptional regulator [Corallincola platygyrae]|uniref:LuxR C-terminal-related transcriptional regulator n=1 Tax=Corallincola platygyrae TaxID=1193278 RepID=A0ABW4XL86_9GAMM